MWPYEAHLFVAWNHHESFPIVSCVCPTERLAWIPGPVAGMPLPQFQHNLNISLCCLFRKDSLGLVGRSSLAIIRSICVFSKRSQILNEMQVYFLELQSVTERLGLDKSLHFEFARPCVSQMGWDFWSCF